ncbi:MAG: diadenylate cyclase CdaA [Flavobacteriales bacterium]|nr:diadenylate cyclase CdaA [Flavobacteriales bacterium]
MNFLDFDILDIIDIFLVSLLIYQLYKLVRNTVAIKILIGIGAIYILWKVVEILKMDLLSEILGQFIGVGVIAIIIVFQQEIRRFLLILGNKSFSGRRRFFNKIQNLQKENQKQNINKIVDASFNMSRTKTGGLIVLQGGSDLSDIIESGKKIDAVISRELIETIFYKNNPLHDGAMIIHNGKIVAASCILPMSERLDIKSSYGTRHRAALGISETTDAITLVISEETGLISLTEKGQFITDLSEIEIKQRLLASLE